MLELPLTDWSARLKKEQSDAKALQLKNASMPDTIRVANTQISHPISSFAGIYEHPAYGNIEIVAMDEALKGSFKLFDFGLKHYHYDTFETQHTQFDKQKLTFYTNANGKIEKLGLVLEVALGKEIIFIRK